MNKLSIKVDVHKLDRSRFVERSYTNKDGVDVKVKEMSLDIVPLKEENEKVVYENETSQLVKTHFVTEQATKEERASKTNTAIVGEGLMWKDKSGAGDMDQVRKLRENAQKVQDDFNEIDPSDIPF